MNPIVMWFQVFQKYLFIRKQIGTSVSTTIKMIFLLIALACVWNMLQNLIGRGKKRNTWYFITTTNTPHWIHSYYLQKILYLQLFTKNILNLIISKFWKVTIIEDHIYFFLLLCVFLYLFICGVNSICKYIHVKNENGYCVTLSAELVENMRQIANAV